MTEKPILLTPKNLYRLLKGSFKPIKGPVFLKPDKTHTGTLSLFWWHCLSGMAPGDVMDPIFQVNEGRSRSLSNIMNRSCPHPLPMKLRSALTDGLQADNFRNMVYRFHEMLDQTDSILAAFKALTELEDLCLEQDPVLASCRDFILSLRQAEWKPWQGRNRGFFILAWRLSWLSLHAIMGDEMDCPAMQLLRLNVECRPEHLWDLWMSSSRQMRFSVLTGAPEDRFLTFTPPETDIPEEEAAARLAEATTMMPEGSVNAESFRACAGWYVVANWTDDRVSINDLPRPTYHGSKSLATVCNGRAIYVLMASGYLGLNRSPGCWGLACVDGITGYVPMNLLIRLED